MARVVPRRKAGWPRAPAAIPVLLLNSLLPVLFHDVDEVLTKSLLLICLFWICNFRVLALCLDRGPLVRQRSLIHFFAVYMLPITPCNNESKRGQPIKIKSSGKFGSTDSHTGRSFKQFLTKSAVAACVTYTLISKGDSLSTLSIHILYVINMYACMGCLYDGPTKLATTLIGLQIAPLFNKPVLAESFSSFWGRRWNLCMGHSLRVLIYDPIQEGQLVKSKSEVQHSSKLRRWAAACACFLVSGVMHEVIYWYGNDMHTRNWSWLIFFGVQGVIVGLEGFGKKLMTKTGFNMPHWLAVCVTVSVQMWLAHALFFPALTDARLPVKLRGALLRNYHSLVGVAL